MVFSVGRKRPRSSNRDNLTRHYVLYWLPAILHLLSVVSDPLVIRGEIGDRTGVVDGLCLVPSQVPLGQVIFRDVWCKLDGPADLIVIRIVDCACHVCSDAQRMVTSGICLDSVFPGDGPVCQRLVGKLVG